MKVSTKLTKNALHISFDGELDQSITPKLREDIDAYLEHVETHRVVFDMSKLRFMDSSGVGFLMGRYKKLNAKDISVFIENPNKQIDKVIKISGLYNIIPLLR